MNPKTPVLYIPGRPGIIDLMVACADGVQRSSVYGHTIEQMQERYPGCVLGDLDVVAAASEEMYRSPPVPVTKEDFIQALECLPPDDWTCRSGCETFKMCEYYSGNITTIYARVGTKYYMLRDRGSMKHDDIIAAICGPRS